MATFALSDLHGNREIWEFISGFLEPGDELYFLGDAADRGPDGYAILQEVMVDPRVTYIRGNHDQMFVDAALGDSMWKEHWLQYCGGFPTYLSYMDDPKRDELLNWLAHTPIRPVEYVNQQGQTVILSHAGFTPPEVPSDYDLLWDRDHSNDSWGQNPENIVVVHGHNPVSHVRGSATLGEALFYCRNHKVCIDACTFYSEKAVMLNLDTWEEVRIDASGRRVKAQTVLSSSGELLQASRWHADGKSIRNFVLTDDDGYYYLIGKISHWRDIDMRDASVAVEELVRAGYRVQEYAEDSPVGYHLVGNMTNKEAGLHGGEVWISAPVSLIQTDESGRHVAVTSSGSKYLLTSPLRVM